MEHRCLSACLGLSLPLTGNQASHCGSYLSAPGGQLTRPLYEEDDMLFLLKVHGGSDSHS